MTISPFMFAGHTFLVLSAGTTLGWALSALLRRAHRWTPAVYGRLCPVDDAVPVRLLMHDDATVLVEVPNDDLIWERSNAGYRVTVAEAMALHPTAAGESAGR